MIAFIRLNTPEIRKRLEELGYKDSTYGDVNNDSIATSDTTKSYTMISQKSFDNMDPHTTWNCRGRVDCGTNINMFFDVITNKIKKEDMSFIPNKMIIKVGDRCKTTKEFENFIGKFEIGTEVTITEIDDIRGFGFVDDLGNRCTECGWSGFVKI